MPPISCNCLHDIISSLLVIFNILPPPPATQAISNPNSTTTITTSLPSPPDNLIPPTKSHNHHHHHHHHFSSFPTRHHYLELGNQPSPISISHEIDIDLPEWKRIGKVAQTVGFGAFGGLITLLVYTPSSATTHHALYIVYLTFVCLGLITSICLSAYSVINKGSPIVGLVQKKLIYFTLIFVAFACFFLLQIALTLVDLGLVMMPVLIVLLVIVIYLHHIIKTGRSFAIEQRHADNC